MLLKAIVEETNPEETQGGRARRAQDGAFVIGAKKEKRLIEPYKYWRVDNKDKNKKRKTMAGKLWKGAKEAQVGNSDSGRGGEASCLHALGHGHALSQPLFFRCI